jgi:hypothetical protein
LRYINDVYNSTPALTSGQSQLERFSETAKILFMDLNDRDPSLTLTDRIIMEDDSHFEFVNAGDGELVVDNNDNDLFYRDLPIVPEVEQPTYLESRILTKPVELFKSHMVAGNPLLAASVVVTQALLQTSPVTVTPLPVANVKLFLYLAKLVISTGKLQQGNLSKVLQILCPYAEKCETSWAPIPCTVPGFTSRITNVTNSNSLVSILPIPSPETLPDGHGYTPFRDILTHALMMKNLTPLKRKIPNGGQSPHQRNFWTSSCVLPNFPPATPPSSKLR